MFIISNGFACGAAKELLSLRLIGVVRSNAIGLLPTFLMATRTRAMVGKLS